MREVSRYQLPDNEDARFRMFDQRPILLAALAAAALLPPDDKPSG